mgnify:CR=1 FL=1
MSGTNNCHLSVSDFSCSIEDDCKWINGKCISTKSHETCDEIKNEVNCNNSNLNCIYDNSSSKCLNHTQDNKSKGNSDLDCFCKAILGDTSDNIPKVIKRLGEKTALKLYNDKDLLMKKF